MSYDAAPSDEHEMSNLSAEVRESSSTTDAAPLYSANGPPSPRDSFRGAVLSAVYTDMKLQENRAKNLVVSGLQPRSDCDDKTAVLQLCEKELSVVPDIQHCRQLERAIPGRTQPVLVLLRSAEQASTVLSAAKNLRNSPDEEIRNIYINPNLTKAQAAAAYQLCCQRRQARLERASRRDKSGQPAHDAKVNTVTDAIPSGSRSLLNLSAAKFVPSLSTNS